MGKDGIGYGMGELEIEGMVWEGRAMGRGYGMVRGGVGYGRRGLEVEGIVGGGGG